MCVKLSSFSIWIRALCTQHNVFCRVSVTKICEFDTTTESVLQNFNHYKQKNKHVLMQNDIPIIIFELYLYIIFFNWIFNIIFFCLGSRISHFNDWHINILSECVLLCALVFFHTFAHYNKINCFIIRMINMPCVYSNFPNNFFHKIFMWKFSIEWMHNSKHY